MSEDETTRDSETGNRHASEDHRTQIFKTATKKKEISITSVPFLQTYYLLISIAKYPIY